MPVFLLPKTGGFVGLFSLSHLQTKAISLAALLACLLLLSACTASHQTSTETSAPTREITDDAGRRVSFPAHVDRVISLAPNLTEIVFAIGAGDHLVGRTSYCNYPAEAKAVAEVGDTLHPSLERIISLKPQVVLISTASQLEVFTQQLQNQNIAVFVTDPHDLNGVFRSIEVIGSMLGHWEEAALLVQKLRERANAVEEAVKQKPPVRVFYQVSAEPLYTAGHDAFVTDLMRRAGAISVTADVPGAWPKYSNESALAAKPEAIVLPTGGSMGEGNSTVTEALRQSPAALAGRVYKINDDHLARPGPRAIDGLEAMARAFHPEAFKQ
jgi:iron complex transport system substrate-binding protein